MWLRSDSLPFRHGMTGILWVLSLQVNGLQPSSPEMLTIQNRLDSCSKAGKIGLQTDLLKAEGLSIADSKDRKVRG